MKNRQNKPNFEKCVVLLMMALEFAERGGFEANRGIVEQPPPPVEQDEGYEDRVMVVAEVVS